VKDRLWVTSFTVVAVVIYYYYCCCCCCSSPIGRLPGGAIRRGFACVRPEWAQAGARTHTSAVDGDKDQFCRRFRSVRRLSGERCQCAFVSTARRVCVRPIFGSDVENPTGSLEITVPPEVSVVADVRVSSRLCAREFFVFRVPSPPSPCTRPERRERTTIAVHHGTSDEHGPREMIDVQMIEARLAPDDEQDG